jgi:Pyruvate/2-oxoacid:ferredoxin oxidoreductase delta subunit
VSSSSVCDTPGVSWSQYQLHVTTTVTTGTTTGGWFLNFNMPSIVNNFTGCTSCYLNCPERIDTMISQVNSFYNTTFAERTYTNGIRYEKPFFDSEFVRKNVSSPSTASTLSGGWTYYTSYNLDTYPASGITNTLIPSLSATTWDFPNHSLSTSTSNAYQYYQNLYYTKVEITSTTPTIEFKVYSQQVTNWTVSGPWIEIYDSTNPTVFNSNYMY